MTDVIQAATHYRARLKKELAKVEQFLGMAESFVKDGKATSMSFYTKKPVPVEEADYAGPDHIDFIR